MAEKKETKLTSHKTYEFFKINIRKADPSLFKSEVHLSANDALRAVLGHKGSSLDLFVMGKKGDAIRYKNNVLGHKDDIALLRIHNEKELKFSRYDADKESGVVEDSVFDYPPCHVIIDHREGQEHLAIEKAVGWGKTDRAKQVVEESLNRLLLDFGWQVDIAPVSLYMEFAEFHRQRVADNHRMQCITIKVLNPDKYTNLSIPEKPEGIIRDALDYLKRYNGFDFLMQTTLDTSSHMDEQPLRDLSDSLCVAFSNGFKTRVKYDNDAIYSNGATKAAFQLSVKDLQDFRSEKEVAKGKTAIELFLDDAYTKINRYRNDIPVRKKPARMRKKGVPQSPAV